MEMIEDTLRERGGRYGDFSQHATATDALVTIMEISPAWQKMNAVQKQATRVILDKFGRMAYGDPNYDDNWRDIMGYAKLVLDRLTITTNTEPRAQRMAHRPALVEED